MVEGENRPTRDDVFLVSGGAKGITAQCVIELAERYRCGFILIGRSPYDAAPPPAWAVGQVDESALKRAAMAHLRDLGERPTPRAVQTMVKKVLSQREIAETLEAVAALGGRAVYASVDVTDGATLEAAVTESVQELGPVTGILHGAGVLADKLIQQKTAADFDLVVSVKVDGLRNLLALVPQSDLKYLILFSSVAGFYGNIGQADYAIANEILNKIAHRLHRRHPDCRVLAVDWGPWDGGMVTPALKRQLARRGIDVIPVDEGSALLADLIAAPPDAPPQVVVGSRMEPPVRDPGEEKRAHTIRRRLSLADNSFLRDHVIGGHAVLPTVCAVGWMVNACEQLYPGYRFFRVDGYRALKGIVFDSTLADLYRLDLEMTPQDQGETLVFDAMIHSRRENGRPLYHYAAQVTLRHEIPAAPLYDGPTAPKDATAVDGDILYRDGTLFHGPSFQGVDALLHIDEQGLVMRCQLPEIPVTSQGQFPVRTFNPYLTDVQLQSLLVWAKHVYGYGGLPLRIQEGVQYRRADFGEVTHVSMQVQQANARRLVADVVVFGGDGNICSQVRGAEITLSERLNVLFAQNTLPVTAQPVNTSTIGRGYGDD